MGTTEVSLDTLVAFKAFTMGGRDYKPGDPVNVSHLPDHKVKQLLNQRYLRPATPSQVPTE